MESVGKKPPRRRSFTAELKAEIVELCQRGDLSIDQDAAPLKAAVSAGLRRVARCRHERPNLARLRRHA
jgi:transposase